MHFMSNTENIVMFKIQLGQACFIGNKVKNADLFYKIRMGQLCFNYIAWLTHWTIKSNHRMSVEAYENDY